MTGANKIIVEMTTEDADAFVKFRAFQGAFEILVRHNAVDIKNGSVTMHFDKFGLLKNVQVIHNYYD